MQSRAAPYVKAISKRLLAGIPVFLLVTFGATALSSLAPGSPAQLILGDNATPEQIAALDKLYGYDLPLWERYLHWLGGFYAAIWGRLCSPSNPCCKSSSIVRP